MLLGITEFTKAYLQVKENPWPYVNLAKLVQNAKIGEGEVVAAQDRKWISSQG